jgi:membrane associated rhomboid family serine protease
MMIPISDSIRGRRFPYVNVVLIAANFAVWLFYELPHLERSIAHASFYPCTLNGSCHGPEAWPVSWITAMFMHGSWAHILGNMLFLVIFGNNVEDAFGHVGYLVFYFAGGFVSMLTQAIMTLAASSAAAARIPSLGASGAIAAVLGAYIVLYPRAKITTLVLFFPLRISAWFFLGFWFVYQVIEVNGLNAVTADGGGVAFFAHIGGFVFGVLMAFLLSRTGLIDANGGASEARLG